MLFKVRVPSAFTVYTEYPELFSLLMYASVPVLETPPHPTMVANRQSAAIQPIKRFMQSPWAAKYPPI
jgi:hypothetical protein